MNISKIYIIGLCLTHLCYLSFLTSHALFQVAVLDVDICGPSIPRVLGVDGEQVHHSSSGWSPVVSEQLCQLVSITNLQLSFAIDKHQTI